MIIMICYRVLLVFVFTIICVSTEDDENTSKMSKSERFALREEARSMFYHAYSAYMDNAYPADELLPLSCKGRWKGVTPSRGDLDDVLGNFSLTLVDSMDTLAVMGDFSEFSRAIKLVIKDVTFDHDIVVSVFETNIRMLGGLLSAHILATALQNEVQSLNWYDGQLLVMADDLGKRLLPAFNTSTGIPHGRINLRHGVQKLLESKETCTACAGTMILEMAALSRLTSNPVYEQKAHRAMDRLWKIRNRTSDLMGTVINIHSGDWVRKDSGVGAGIDSYYEYCLKAYILLGDQKYLARFNRHYNAVMKYISKGPIMLSVHMHRPHLQSCNFMDALLAFWPGIQVLLGEVQPAVETHEMLYQVMQRHTFIPEAFTSDFQVHWGQHPLRPEFIESTYYLHRATGDDHYLQVGKAVLRSLQQYTRVPCGYAAVNDVRTRAHEDRMDSFVLSETFKYLFMLFGDDKDLPVKLEDYVLTTEAHFLPLSLAMHVKNTTVFKKDGKNVDSYRKTCPNTASLVPEKVRQPMRHMLGTTAARPSPRLRPLSDPRQINVLSDMGISVITLPDGRVQLLYTINTASDSTTAGRLQWRRGDGCDCMQCAAPRAVARRARSLRIDNIANVGTGHRVSLFQTMEAKSSKDAAEGLTFMQEMFKWNKLSDVENGVLPAGVKINDMVFPAGPGHFGKELSGKVKYSGNPVFVEPRDACTEIKNKDEVAGKIGIAIRGLCTFAAKVTIMQEAGVEVAIILDNVKDSSYSTTTLFAMSGNGRDDIEIPAAFLFSQEGEYLKKAMLEDPNLIITVGELKSISVPPKQQNDVECKDGKCDAVLGQSLVQNGKESFDDLKKVLSQLVAQFDLSVSIDGSPLETCENNDQDAHMPKDGELCPRSSEVAKDSENKLDDSDKINADNV